MLFTGSDAGTGAPWDACGCTPATTGRNQRLVYDVEVDEDRRGQGWGRALMTYAEQWARERAGVGLNVFGGNTRPAGSTPHWGTASARSP